VSVILLRHASAVDRDEWSGDDTLRPLDDRGRGQALALCDRLSERRVTRIASSPYVRCVETVEPLAAALGIEVELDERLAEGAPTVFALSLLADLDGGLACTHGDVIEELLDYGLRKSAAVVVEIDSAGVRVLEALPAPHN
jgi:phosphohistidine phosphatase SixA